jgi:hypothetical protein
MVTVQQARSQKSSNGPRSGDGAGRAMRYAVARLAENHQYQAEPKSATSITKRPQRLAQQSTITARKNGSLCAHNIQTLIEARNALQDESAGAAQAKAQLSSCRVDRPVRVISAGSFFC